MKHEEGWLEGVEEARIYWQAWLPDSASHASVVLAHGVSEHSARYGHVGEALSAAGYALYAVDHRGHGRSDGTRANIDRLDYVVADLLQLVERVTERDGGRKPFLLGHSMGGGVSIAFAIEHQNTIEGLLLSGATADPEAASAVTRALSRLTSAIAPNLGVFPVDAKAVSRDPVVVRAYEEDPLVYHDKLRLARSARWSPDQPLSRGVPGLRLPMLVMHGGDDSITPVAGSRMVAERAGSEDKTLKIYEGLLRDPERARAGPGDRRHRRLARPAQLARVAKDAAAVEPARPAARDPGELAQQGEPGVLEPLGAASSGHAHGARPAARGAGAERADAGRSLPGRPLARYLAPTRPAP